MHADPPVYHRDIRQPNIMRHYDGQGWFLIDWSDASTAPTYAARHLKRWEHSPSVQEDNHGPEVDIWGIGKYMEQLASSVVCGFAKPEAVKSMAYRWMRNTSTTAGSALCELEVSIYHPSIREIY